MTFGGFLYEGFLFKIWTKIASHQEELSNCNLEWKYFFWEMKKPKQGG